MLERNLMIGWVSGLLLLVVFFNIRVAVPALVNLHNDGALLLAILLIGLTVTLPIVVFFRVIKPLFDQEP